MDYDLWSDDFDRIGANYHNLPHPCGVTEELFREILLDLEGNYRDLDSREILSSINFYNDLYRVYMTVDYFQMLERVSWYRKDV